MAIAKGMVHFIFYDRAKLLFSSRQVRQKYQTLGLFEAQPLRTVTRGHYVTTQPLCLTI